MVSTLPQLPADWSAPEGFSATATFSSPVKRQVEPVGPGFLAHARRTLRGRTWSEDEKIQAQQNVKKVEDDNNDDLVEDEPEDPEMLKRDPKDWKKQDHYAVLGLSKYRYKATEEQIRIAHRRKVLKHHPDKKAAEGQLNEDGFFKCIQKAFEILLDSNKRRQWDSVDPKANVLPPKNKGGDFFEDWTKVFDAEGRFSNKQPVPSLGTLETEKPEVDAFYAFFYNFDSWRTFEYLDEDVPDDTSNRDNKRYIEKKNKAARQKHKTDDIARLRKLVDTALKLDPRIQLFKEKERKAKEQRKWEREAGAREAAEAEKKAKEEAEKKRAEEESASKAAKENSKKAKEAAKNAKKKNKRTIRGSVKDVNYFAAAGSEPSAADIDAILNDVDAIIDKLDDVKLQDLANKLSNNPDADTVKAAFTESKDVVSGLKYF
ncbi:zuotin [Sugiyamaella lignohabitans]|uniref:Zuotin n=1 Tax=Sugiyamaella lignohabitans TaxID=796027 RepID=A0A167D2I2_9ASCO|nr:zuotin [Sugiyamaella lignohabitans]ANB12396.1 zuotin [Sugiyamaella lignohabitans]